MKRMAFVLVIALVITATVVAIIGLLVPLASDAMMAYIRQDPAGPFWVRVLTPILPAFSIIVFGLAAAVRRRKVARASSNAEVR